MPRSAITSQSGTAKTIVRPIKKVAKKAAPVVGKIARTAAPIVSKVDGPKASGATKSTKLKGEMDSGG